MKIVTAIIPTFNNFDQLRSCVMSLLETGFTTLGDILIVNNGDGNLELPYTRVINTGENLGWEGGLVRGLEECHTEYILFLNDDTFIPKACSNWIIQMLEIAERDPSIGAMGPTSNVVRAWQNIFMNVPDYMIEVEYLIGFCMLIRRIAFESAGGIDTSLPGGDDLDLSIRLKDAGYKLVIDRRAFVFHHGFGTGIRLHGDSNTAGGWNSRDMVDNTNMALIKKHGFYRWWIMMRNYYKEYRNDVLEDYVVEGGLRCA
jgi:GT2 family glycosyltransferase